MKKVVFLLVFVALGAAGAFAQKAALNHDVYDSWERVTGVALTPDGTILSYSITPQEGDATLYLRRTTDGKTLEVPRGASLSVSPDADWAYCLVKPFFQETRAARIKGKKKDQLPKDSLAIINLKTLEVKKIAKVSGFKTGFDSMPYVAYQTDKKTIVLDPSTQKADTLKNVDSYLFSGRGTTLAAILKKDKKDSLSRDEVILLDVASHTRKSLHSGAKWYKGLSFNEAGDALVFLTSEDTVSLKYGGDRHCAIMLSRGGEAAQVLVGADYTNGELMFNQNAAPFFSKSGNRVFAGLSYYKPPKDSTIVDFETARVNIWNYDALVTPPMAKAQKSRLENFTFSAVIDVDSKEVVRLEQSYLEGLNHFDGGDAAYALSVDRAAYQLSSFWDSNPYNDVSVVSLKDGSHEPLLTKVAGRPRLSPAGKYAIWYDADELQWFTIDIATKEVRNITQACGTAFYDEEDDHPHYPDSYDYRPLWTKDDRYVLICDRYDVWMLGADGSSARCLTMGEGRRNKVRFRLADPVNRGVSRSLAKLGVGYVPALQEPLYFTVFDEVTKENGFGYLKSIKPAVPVWFKDEYSFAQAAKAENAAVLAFVKGNFRNSPNLYLAAAKAGKKGYPVNFRENFVDVYAGASRLTATNPQQQDYRWGDVQLVHWNAYDGTPLDGLLYVPEDIPQGEKVPLMIYFYEKRSESLFSYVQPAPSRSTVNLAFYVSRGYAVFVPDIVYTPGHPGKSAYNCICSGAEAMCSQFPFIDKERMAIQGQSWGGYQVAYLVTCTDMFKAAGAGAPVGNMTSAYGGIRWESGVARAMQYEHGQSRIGKSMWEDGGLELYIENSPVFFADKVNTPVLIMSNDADGAVPWYQGIEFFSDLRRFGKPAWLLQYNDEAHNLVERRNCKDLSRRLQEFFDHYLLGSPLPDWMQTPDPSRRNLL